MYLVDFRLHKPRVYDGGAFGQFLHHIFLHFGRLYYDILKLSFRHGQVKHIGCLNVSHILKHTH
jgi:hypothetical protein